MILTVHAASQHNAARDEPACGENCIDKHFGNFSSAGKGPLSGELDGVRQQEPSRSLEGGRAFTVKDIYI